MVTFEDKGIFTGKNFMRRSILQAELESTYCEAAGDAFQSWVITYYRLVVLKLEVITSLILSQDWLDRIATCETPAGH